jgi:hypothetical protein
MPKKKPTSATEPDEIDVLLKDGAVSPIGAGEFCGCSDREIWRAMADGEIVFFYNRSSRLIAREELRRWLRKKYEATARTGRVDGSREGEAQPHECEHPDSDAGV